MVNILIATIWFIGVLYWDVQSDYIKISAGVPINHKKEFLHRIAWLIPSAIGFLTAGTFNAFNVPVVFCMLGAWWWEFFDGLLNQKRGYPWRFNGGEDPDDPVSDNILQDFTPTQQMLLKWGLISVFTALYIIIQF